MDILELTTVTTDSDPYGGLDTDEYLNIYYGDAGSWRVITFPRRGRNQEIVESLIAGDQVRFLARVDTDHRPVDHPQAPGGMFNDRYVGRSRVNMTHWRFTCREAAMLFKLTWGGV